MIEGTRTVAGPTTEAAKRGVNPGVTPGFKAEYDSAVNVAVIQGLSPLVSRATSSGLSAAANRAETREFSAAVSLDVNATFSPAVNRASSRAANSGLTCAFSRELSSAFNRALSLRSNVALSAEANAAVPVRVLCPAAATAPNSCEQRVIPAGVPSAVSHLSGKAAAPLPQSKDLTVIYM